MKFNIYDVFLVDFKNNIGGELSGKHYAVILSKITKPDNTLIVVPITSKKKGKKYRNGFTIDCKKYQTNPSSEKAFVKANKIREVSVNRIYGDKIYSLDFEDIEKLKNSIRDFLKLD